MGWFNRKKKDTNFSIEKNTKPLTVLLDQDKYSSKNLIKIPIIIKPDTFIFQIASTPRSYIFDFIKLGGTETYKFTIETEQGPFNPEQETSAKAVKSITTSINLGLLLDLLKNKRTNLELEIEIRDITHTYKERINFTLDLTEILQILKQEEKLDLTSISLILDKTYPEKITLKFEPELELQTLEHNPTLDILFEQGFGFENISKTDLPEVRFQEAHFGSYNFILETITQKLKSPEQLLAKKKETMKVTIRVETPANIFSKEFKINIIELMRTFLDQKDYHNFKESDLVAVRMLSSEDFAFAINDRQSKPKNLFGSPWKPTIHFTLNHVVVGHGEADWENTDIALIVPFKELKNKNIKTFYGGTTVDIFFVGYVQLPKEVTIVKRNPRESWNSFVNRINTIITFNGFRVMIGGDYNWFRDDYRVTQWLSNFGYDHGWKNMIRHHDTPFGKIENKIMTYDHADIDGLPPEQASKVFREKYVKIFEQSYPQDYNTFKKQLNAWLSFWNKY